MARINSGLISIIVAVMLQTGSGAACAQQPEALEVPPGESTLIKRKSIVIIRKRSERDESPGIRLKNFILHPSVSLTEYYDDNVFAARDSEEGDLVTVITPALELESDWDSHAVNLKAGMEAVRHTELSAENTDNAWFELQGRYDFVGSNRLFAGIDYTRDHEDRASADAAAGEHPAEFDDLSASLGFSGNKNDHFYRLTVDSRDLDYDDVGSPLGEIDYDDRDRNERGLGLRYLHRFASTWAMFMELEFDERDYDQTPDNEGNERNSDGSRYVVGAELIGSKYVSRIYAGRMLREYREGSFSDADEIDLGWRLSWEISDAARLVFRSSRSIEETVLDGSPGYVMRNASLGLRYALSPERTLEFDLIGASADYLEIDRDDDYLNYGVGYSQQLMPNLGFGVDLHHARRDSSVDNEDYRINQVFVRLKASL